MKIETKFSNGDVVYHAYTNYGPTGERDCEECGGKGSLAVEGKPYRMKCIGWHCRDGKVLTHGPMPYAQVLTIGQIRVEISDSPGLDGESIFRNLGPQHERNEMYMAVETGIGSGSLYYAEDLFHTEAEALEHAKIKAIEYQRKEEARKLREEERNREQVVYET